MLVKQDEKLSESIEPNLYLEKGKRNGSGLVSLGKGFTYTKAPGVVRVVFVAVQNGLINMGHLKKQIRFLFFKMGTGSRKPIRWFDPVIDKNLPFLADVVAEYAADMQMDATRIFVDKEDRE